MQIQFDTDNLTGQDVVMISRILAEYCPTEDNHPNPDFVPSLSEHVTHAVAANPAEIFASTPPNVAGAAPALPTMAVPSAPTAATQAALPLMEVPTFASALRAQSASPDLDSAGLPWDPRIHSGNKAKNADGKWRQRRGLNDDGLVKTVGAELRNGGNINPTPTHAKPDAALLPPPPPVAQPEGPLSFEQFMPKVTAAVVAGKLQMADVVHAVTAHQIANIPALAQHPEAVPKVWDYLKYMHPGLQ